jgi:hypothetical protein
MVPGEQLEAADAANPLKSRHSRFKLPDEMFACLLSAAAPKHASLLGQVGEICDERSLDDHPFPAFSPTL